MKHSFSDYSNDNLYKYTFKDIETFLIMKLPLPIAIINKLAQSCSSYKELAGILFVKTSRKRYLLTKNNILLIGIFFLNS